MLSAVARSVIAAAGVTLLSTSLAAQASAPVNRGTIDGIVSDTNLTPLHAAFVSIVGTPLRVGTGPNGRFRITNIKPGQYLLIVKRVGYRPTSGVVDVPPSDTLRRCE